MTNFIRIIAGVVLIVGAGLVHGAWTNRWRPAPALTALAARLESVPMVIGDWTATPIEMDLQELSMAGAVGYLSRRYANPSRGTAVSVLLLCGLPGKMTTHTPDICYPGGGFTLSPSTRFSRPVGSPERSAEFQTAVASRGGPKPSVLRLFWAWNASQGWVAPDNPRWTLASAPALCKLYVIRETSGRVVDPKEDPCNDFLTLFLPELDRIVFSGPLRPAHPARKGGIAKKSDTEPSGTPLAIATP